ncbi:hypothetical protein [Planktothrix mougeotii]|uniref:Uncharacterized protein n=1 Tax=Planktothrix mougeotii LEGE 06226 TaxID=1828728 RepID=A0ABR9UGX4_9CYAN|nr:hypothetical protein [Planktothrix mougeotii]MBE9144794.1 hypothetical protein [Planktothrix mougeotii LEGE 06226]
MNNPLDNGDEHNLDSIFNNLIQSLGIDPHQQQIPSAPDFHSHDPHHPHFDISNLGGHGEYYQGLHSSFISDLDPQTPELHPNGAELEQFNPYQQPAQTDYSTPDQSYHNSGIEYHSQQMSTFSEMQTFNYVQSGDSNSVHIYADGDVYWDSGGQAGHIEGQKFYNTSHHYMGHLGADMKVYDAHDKCIGWVDTKGHAYTLDGAVFAEGKTPIWAATVLVFNTSSPG